MSEKAGSVSSVAKKGSIASSLNTLSLALIDFRSADGLCVFVQLGIEDGVTIEVGEQFGRVLGLVGAARGTAWVDVSSAVWAVAAGTQADTIRHTVIDKAAFFILPPSVETSIDCFAELPVPSAVAGKLET